MNSETAASLTCRRARCADLFEHRLGGVAGSVVLDEGADGAHDGVVAGLACEAGGVAGHGQLGDAAVGLSAEVADEGGVVGDGDEDEHGPLGAVAGGERHERGQDDHHGAVVADALLHPAHALHGGEQVGEHGVAELQLGVEPGGGVVEPGESRRDEDHLSARRGGVERGGHVGASGGRSAGDHREGERGGEDRTGQRGADAFEHGRLLRGVVCEDRHDIAAIDPAHGSCGFCVCPAPERAGPGCAGAGRGRWAATLRRRGG